MASTRPRETKDGRRYYEIRCRRGREKAGLSMRWYVPDGWSQKAIDRELAKVSAEFERQVQAGEIITRAEKEERAMLEAAEAAKIQTLRQYSEKVFMPSLTIRCAEHTRDNFQRSLDLYILPALGPVKMPDVSSAQITALLTKVQSEPNRFGHTKGNYIQLLIDNDYDYVSLGYIAADADQRLDEMQTAINNRMAEQERIKLQEQENNFNGL